MDVNSIISFAFVSLMVAISPGASWIFVIHATVSSGIRGGIAAICGNASGILVHAVLAFMGLAIFIQLIPQLMWILKFCGAMYLIYIGVKNIFYAKSLAVNDNRQESSTREIFLDATMMNLLNPKVSILMLALLPQFVDMNTQKVFALYLGALHACIASTVLSMVMLLTKKIFSHRKYFVVFSWFSGFILCIFAMQLILY